MDNKKELSDVTIVLGISAAFLVGIVAFTGIGKDNWMCMTLILAVTVGHIVSFYYDIKRISRGK